MRQKYSISGLGSCSAGKDDPQPGVVAVSQERAILHMQDVGTAGSSGGIGRVHGSSHVCRGPVALLCLRALCAPDAPRPLPSLCLLRGPLAGSGLAFSFLLCSLAECGSWNTCAQSPPGTSQDPEACPYVLLFVWNPLGIPHLVVGDAEAVKRGECPPNSSCMGSDKPFPLFEPPSRGSNTINASRCRERGSV